MLCEDYLVLANVIRDPIQVHHMVVNWFVQRDVALRHSGAQRFDDVAVGAHKKGRMVPVRELAVFSAIPETLANANQPACPAVAASQNKVAGQDP